MKNFEVKLYYSGFCSYEIKAQTEEEAIQKTRLLSINEKEIVSNLETWHDADTVEEI